MKTTLVGFASVICCSVMALPLLVQTAPLSAQPEQKRVEERLTLVAGNSECASDTGERRRAGQSTTKWQRPGADCPAFLGLKLADAR